MASIYSSLKVRRLRYPHGLLKIGVWASKEGVRAKKSDVEV